MFEFPFIGGTEGNNIAQSPQRTINLYPEAGRNKSPVTLVGWPGDKIYESLPTSPYRGSKLFRDHAVVVSGSVVYKLDKGGDSTALFSMTTTSGFVEIAENGVQLMIVDGEDGYVWDGTSYEKISNTTFNSLNSDSVTYLDANFIVNRPGSGEIYVSESLDALEWGALRYGTAEYKTDEVIKVWEDRELMLGGTRSTQLYYRTGASPMPYAPVRQGRVIYGIAAKNSVVVINNSTHALFREEHGGVFFGKFSGYNVQRLSTRSLDQYFYSIDYKDAYAMGVEIGGHEMYLITFPEADTGKGRTFGYEAETGMFFEVGKYAPDIGDFEKYHALGHLFFDDKNLIFDVDGCIWELDPSNYKFQDSNEIISKRVSPVIHTGRERLFFNSAQFDIEVGRGTTSGQGVAPVARLEISDDGGHTYGNFREQSIGLTGEYANRVKFERLGSAYDRVFALSISDPVPRKFISGYIE